MKVLDLKKLLIYLLERKEEMRERYRYKLMLFFSRDFGIIIWYVVYYIVFSY